MLKLRTLKVFLIMVFMQYAQAYFYCYLFSFVEYKNTRIYLGEEMIDKILFITLTIIVLRRVVSHYSCQLCQLGPMGRIYILLLAIDYVTRESL